MFKRNVDEYTPVRRTRRKSSRT